MADDLSSSAPMTRLVVRNQPLAPVRPDGASRTIWRGFARSVGFLGTLATPVAQAWNLAGGPGGQGSVVVANFLQKFGSPVMLDYGRQVNIPLQSSPYVNVQAFLEYDGQVRNSSEENQSVEQVLATRYEAMTSSTGEIY